MFPYQYKRKTLTSMFHSNFKSIAESVKLQYENAYNAIVQLVNEQNYMTPQSYSKNGWKRVMIELQCTAYVKLKSVLASGKLPLNQFDDMQLEYLTNKSNSSMSKVNWHDLYMRSCNKQ